MLSKFTHCPTIADTDRALGTFGEQKRSLNTPKCIRVHMGAFGERLCSPNVPNALP